MKADDTQRSNFLSFFMFCVVMKKIMKKKMEKKSVEVNDAAFGLRDAP